MGTGTVCIAAAVVTFLAAAVANGFDTIVLVAILVALLGMLWSLVCWGTCAPDGHPTDVTIAAEEPAFADLLASNRPEGRAAH